MRPQKSDIRKARQEAVAVHYRDKSTNEITSGVDNMNALISMYEQQRMRNQRAISEANADTRTCDKMIDELRADVATLDAIVKARRC